MGNFWSCMSFYLMGNCVCAPPRLNLALGKWDTKPKCAFLSKRKKRDFSSEEVNIFYISTITLRKGLFLARWICFFFSFSSEANAWKNYWYLLLHIVSFIHLLKVCNWNKSGDVWNFSFGRVLPNAVVKNKDAFQVDRTGVDVLVCRDDNTIHGADFLLCCQLWWTSLINEQACMGLSTVMMVILGGWFCRRFLITFPPTLKPMTVIEVSVSISCVLG